MLTKLFIAGLFALAALVSPGANAQPTCSTGAVALYCAEASSYATLECELRESELARDFDCDIVAKHQATGTSLGWAPGQLLVPSSLEIGICNGEGLCEQTVHALGAPCTWTQREYGCGTGGDFTQNLSGTLDGCLYVWAYQTVNARVRAPGVAADLAQDEARSIAEYDSCA